MKKESNQFTLLIPASVFFIAMTKRKTKKLAFYITSVKQKTSDFNFQKKFNKASPLHWLITLWMRLAVQKN